MVAPAFLDSKWEDFKAMTFDMDKVGVYWWWMFVLKLCLLTP